MGIKNLHTLLRKHCPDAYTTQPLTAYRYKKIAIDASLYMFKYKCAAGDRWISCFVSLLAALRRNEIHIVFVFDNGAPPEKQQERENRQSSRQKIEDKAIRIEQDLSEYYNTGHVSQFLRELQDNLTKSVEKKLLRPIKSETIFNEKLIEAELRKLQNQSISISKQDFDTLRNLLNIMNVPIFEAPEEAEKKSVELCHGKTLYAVMTEDTDVLTYGCPIFLSNIDYHKGTCTELAIEDILDLLEITMESFVDLCIMCGTDYNKNIYKIGPEKSYTLIKKYQNIDEIAKNEPKIDISCLNHIRVRELFQTVPDDSKIPFCQVPDFKALDVFLFENNSKVDVSGLKKSFEQHELSFED